MTNIHFILIVLISLNTYGQSEELDTIRFKPIETTSIESIEYLEMKIIDTLNKPKAFILSQGTFPELIALKKKNKYITFNLLPEPSYGTVTKIEKKQVNGKNYKELVVYSETTYGHSGLGGGLRETHKAIIIYDLKKLEKIFDQEYFFSTYSWDNDVSDNLTVSSTTEYFECNNCKIKVMNKKILFELKENEECDEIDLSDFIETKWIYELKKNMFIKHTEK
ncbi:hypothetical protein [Lacinutrix salivirga]